MSTQPKHTLCRITFAIQIFAIISLLAIFVSRPTSAEPAVTTKFYCNAPVVPALFLATKMPLNTAIFEKAIREGVCEYNPEPVGVTPLSFVQRIEANPTSIESRGYIWAFRLSGGREGYWYFWKAEHEAMLRDVPGI